MSRAQAFADSVPVDDEGEAIVDQGDPNAGQGAPAAAPTEPQPAADPNVADPNAGNPTAGVDPAASGVDDYTIRQFLTEEGFQGVSDAADDYEALQRVLAYNRQLQQRENAWQQQLAQAQQQLAFLSRQAITQSQQAGQATGAPGQAGAVLPGAQPQPKQPALPANWQVPEWKPEWTQWIEKNPETGEFVVRSGGDPTLLQKYHAYQGHLQNVAYQLASDPVSFLSQFGFLTQEQAQQQAAELVRRELYQVQQAQALDQLWRENELWMAERDPRTNGPMIDPISRQVVLSEEGQIAKQHFYTLCQQGVAPQQAMLYAKAFVRDGIQSQLLQMQSAPEAARERQEKLNRAFSKGAARRPNRGGARQQEAYRNRPAPNNRDFAAMAWNNAEELGVAAARN